MRKCLAMLAAASLLAGPAWAAEEGQAAAETTARPGTSASAEVALFSAYVSRGQVNNDEAVAQAQVTIEHRGWTLNGWFNYNTTDRVTDDPDFSEVDLWFGRNVEVKGVELEAGVIEYLFPHTVSETDEDGDGTAERREAAPGTREVYFAATAGELWIVPALEAYYDVDECWGWYLTGSLSKDVELGDKLTLTPSFSTGWGSSGYNDYYFGSEENALNDGNLGLKLTYVVGPAGDVSLGVNYMWLWDADVRRAAREEYLDAWSLWSGVMSTWFF